MTKKCSETKLRNGTNSAKVFWNSKSEEEKLLIKQERNETARKTNEEKGRWKKLEDLTDYQIYFNASRFKFGFTNNISSAEYALLEKFGVFNNKSNTKGCVRDHLLSRRFGFENNLPTWIISHPANCQIVLHSENVRRSFTNDNLITLDELLKRIEEYK